MIESIIKTIFGDPNVKKYKIIIAKINENFKDFSDYSIEDVQNKTQKFRNKFIGLDFKMKEDSIKINEILKEIKIEAIANLKQACTLLNEKSFEIGNDNKKIVLQICKTIFILFFLFLLIIF